MRSPLLTRALAAVLAALILLPSAMALAAQTGAKAGCIERQKTRPAVVPATGEHGDLHCRTALELLLWLMSLPQGRSHVTTASTGPGGETILAPAGATAVRLPRIATAATLLAAGQFRANEILVTLRPGASIAVARALARDYGLQLEVFLPLRNLGTAVARLRIPDTRPIDVVLTSLARDPRVLASQPNYIYRPAASAGLPATALPQYALDLIGARQAAALTQGLRQPVVAIIDTGIDDSHPVLSGLVRDRFDAIGDGHWDTGTHGTGIAGIVAAHGALTGVDPGAALLSIRAFAASGGDDPETTSLALLRGLDWAAIQDVDVVNMSLTGPADPLVDAAVDQVMAAGISVVAAAGNGGPAAPPAYPAAVKGVVAVTATDENDKLFAGANRGAYIVVAAPGVDILSATPGGGVALQSGTSQAAAHVSGVLAILRARYPGLAPQAALDLLQRTAKTLGRQGHDDGYGAGRVDAAAALAAAVAAGARP